MRFRRLSALLFGVVLVMAGSFMLIAGSGVSSAADQLDQQCTTVGNTGLPFGNLGQSFVPTASTVAAFDISYSNPSAAQGRPTVAIPAELRIGTPTGTVIASSTLSIPGDAGGTSSVFERVDFGSVAITAGQTYVLVLNGSAQGGSNDGPAWDQCGSAYSGGDGFSQQNGQSGMTATGTDFAFKEYSATNVTTTTTGPTTTSTVPPTSSTTGPTTSTTSTTSGSTTSTSTTVSPTTSTSTTVKPTTTTSTSTTTSTPSPPTTTSTMIDTTSTSTTVKPTTSTTNGSTTSSTAAPTTSAPPTTQVEHPHLLPPTTLSVDPDVLSPGDTAQVSGTGMGGQVTITLYSTPVVLGVTEADANGNFTLTVRIPADTALGDHSIVASGNARLAQVPIKVVPKAGVLPFTGLKTKDLTEIGFILIAAGILFIVMAGHRRPRSA